MEKTKVNTGIDHRGKNQNGILNPNWKGGKSHTNRGYVIVYKPDHPRAWPNGYVFEHILVMEQKLGRYLLPNERPHHINEIKTDNRPENLELKMHGEHTTYHWTGRHHTLKTKQLMSLRRTGKPGLSGESCPTSKLTLVEVTEIISLRGIETGRSLAKRFGISSQQVSRILTGKRWNKCV